MYINQNLQIEDLHKTDLHMHTLYCDGEDTPEAMALSAIEKGFTCIGFSGHSYVEFDPDCGMNHDAVRRYMEEIAALRVKYQEQIRI